MQVIIRKCFIYVKFAILVLLSKIFFSLISQLKFLYLIDIYLKKS